MPDEAVKEKIQEVWITEGGVRYRAYRGRRQSEVDWKVEYHQGKGHNPEVRDGKEY
jgi:hypothetical protein